MLEWLAYHKSLGVDQFLIFTNDCDDGTDLIAKRLTELGHAIHVDNAVKPGGSPQNQMLRRVRRHEAFQRAAWVFCLDVDEFLNVRLPEPSLPALLEKLAQVAGRPVDVASFAWKLFGCGGVETFQDAPITGQFFLCDNETTPHSGLAQGFKSILRNNGKFTRLGPHRPKGLPDELVNDLTWVDGGGKVMPYATISWRARGDFSHEYARIHHYALRSVDSFLVKRDRGRTNHIDRDQDESYWMNMNANHCKDRSMLDATARAEPLRQELMSDPVLAELHAAAVDWHRSRIAMLRAREDWAPFRRFLTRNLLHKATDN